MSARRTILAALMAGGAVVGAATPALADAAGDFGYLLPLSLLGGGAAAAAAGTVLVRRRRTGQGG